MTQCAGSGICSSLAANCAGIESYKTFSASALGNGFAGIVALQPLLMLLGSGLGLLTSCAGRSGKDMTRLIGNFLLDILIIVSECFLSTLVFYTAAVAGSGKFTVGFAGRCGKFRYMFPFSPHGRVRQQSLF